MIKKRILTTLVMMAVLLSLVAVPAMAQSQLDQSQTTVNGAAIMNTNFVSQTFTAGKTGRLDKVSIYVGCCHNFRFGDPDIPDPLQIEVEGTQSSISPMELCNGHIECTNNRWVDVPIEPAPFVQAGEQYRINLSTPSVLYYRIGVATSDVYSGGEAYYGDDGIQWFTKNWDMAFQTYVTPADPCDNPPTRAKFVQPGKPFQGSSASEIIIGTEGGDEIFGGDGNDIICGGGGDDKLYGGEGNDKVYGHNGNDLILGQGGDDYLDGGNGDDRLRGDAGKDSLNGGEDGNDTLIGGAGNDRLEGDGGDDILIDNEGTNELDGGTGNDQCSPATKRVNCESEPASGIARV